MWWLIPLFLLGFILVHLAKMMRLYLVLMEHKISFGSFVLLYLKTTLVNLIIPFKLGELYRIFCINKETGHWQVGVLSILVDRFFDTLALCIILLPLDIFLFGRLSFITLLFLTVMVLVVICYAAVLPTYKYLNRYLIKEKSSPRAMAALKGLEVVRVWYDFTHDLISGRFALILAASFGGWIFEIGTLKVLAVYLALPFDVGDFATYIQAIFGAGSSELLRPYTLYSILLMAVFTVAGVIWISIKSRSKKKA
jgi:hypothetical protein